MTESIALPPDEGSRVVPKYMAYLFGIDSHIIKSEIIECVDEESAIDAAKQFVDGHHVELWERDRKIAGFNRRSE